MINENDLNILIDYVKVIKKYNMKNNTIEKLEGIKKLLETLRKNTWYIQLECEMDIEDLKKCL